MTSEQTREPTAIDAIAERWVDTVASLEPTVGTYIGRDEVNDRFADYSPSGVDALADAVSTVRAELEAAAPVDDVDRVTKDDLGRELALTLQSIDAGLPFRDLNVIDSPAQHVREAFDLMPTSSTDDWAAVSTRLSRVAQALEGYVETLHVGVERGTVPAKRQVREVAAQAEKLAASDGFFAELAERGVTSRASVPEALADDLRRHAAEAAEAYDRFRSYLVDELEPHAPERDAVGRDIYELRSQEFLGAKIDLDETYEWGIQELERMVDEQEAIARQILPGAGVLEAIAHLDTDQSRKLHGTEALQTWMQETSDRAVADLAGVHFDIPDEIRTIECMIAPTTEGGIYYTGPTDDFSRPGRMWWSVPEGVTEFDTWRELTTVYHEGVPGHHLQIGQAVYNRRMLNSWRRLLAGTSGHAEGWALYAERLMQDLGYLDDPADRLGMLDGQRMRAARVVLDIGVHLGKTVPGGGSAWTAEYAFEFMKSNVNMDESFVRFEVNRYLGWPGQAPAYKVGQRIWEQLRDESREREGSSFSLKDFHTRALSLGGVGLDTLRTELLR